LALRDLLDDVRRLVLVVANGQVHAVTPILVVRRRSALTARGGGCGEGAEECLGAPAVPPAPRPDTVAVIRIRSSRLRRAVATAPGCTADVHAPAVSLKLMIPLRTG
jgi:hypothetical protein